MALRTDVVGDETEALVHSLSWKDAVLYALGVGATRDELDFLYEGRGPKVLPTYAVIPAFAAMDELFDKTGGDLLGVVHGAQKITLHRPFAAGESLFTTGKVEGIYDMKRMGQAIFTTETKDGGGDLVCETEWMVLFRNDGGFGGERPPKSFRNRKPDREPDFEVTETTREEQALLYRLSGDHNPLHADPAIGEEAGFGLPILHGLCTYGYAGRAVLSEVCGGDPAKLKELRGQFRKPVWPGETLITRGWREGDEVILRVCTAERPEEDCFTNACATVSD